MGHVWFHLFPVIFLSTMAAAAAAALLDELMGRDRNLAPTDKKRETRWDDQTVCKYYLVKFCPNELFVNTRADLGPCEKIHDDFMKKDFDSTSVYHKTLYEDEFLKFCQGMLSDVEKRIRRGRQRLALGTQEGGIPTPAQVRTNEDQITILNDKIKDLLEKVEELGCEGKVEEAQGVMKLCDQLKEERENLQRANENSHWMQTAEIAAAQEKQMEVCEVCGAFLIVGDAQQRVDDHLMGKQHVGYARIKAAVDEILEKRQKEKEDKEKMRNKEREERRKQREEQDKQREKEAEERRRKRDEERRKEKEKERDHHRSRSSRDKSRKRSRSRSRGRKRSHSRDKRSRSRRSRHSSRDRKKRSRSRSRDRSKRSRRSRSHSSDRDRDKGRDRDRDREKSRKDRGDEKRASDSNGRPQENGTDVAEEASKGSGTTGGQTSEASATKESESAAGNSGNADNQEAVTEKLSAAADAQDGQERRGTGTAGQEAQDGGAGGESAARTTNAAREGDSDD